MIVIAYVHISQDHKVCSLMSIPTMRRLISFLLILLMVATSSRYASAADIDLKPLLDNATDQITLNFSDTYLLSGEYHLTKSITVYGNGATLMLDGPISAFGENGSLVLDNVKITSSGWAAVAAREGAQVHVQSGSEISCVGPNSAIYSGSTVAPSSRASLVNSVISDCVYGVKVEPNASTVIHGSSITDTLYAVMVQGASSSVTIDQQSVLSYTGSAPEPVGVAVIDGASATLRDISVIGFQNGVNITASTPGGKAYIYTSLFRNQTASALSTVNASDVIFSGSRVEDAKMDGIYLRNSKAIIENSEVLRSSETGVTFIGCQSGATIRNSYVRGSVDQGIAVVAYDGVPSLNVSVLNNTIVDSVKPGLLIDGTSTAIVQGNLFTSSTNFSSTSPAIYLEGTQGISLDSSLVSRSLFGLEIFNGGHANMLLSLITDNAWYALLAYGNATIVKAEHNSLIDNNSSGNSDVWSVFTNLGASVGMHNSNIGLSGEKAVYNNAGNSQDFKMNYWGASDGPNLSLNSLTGGTGSFLAWNADNGSSVAYTPFQTRKPIYSNLSHDISLSSGLTRKWDSGSEIGLFLELTGKSGIAPLAGETMAAMVVETVDYSGAGMIKPPSGCIGNRLYVAWISSKLRLASASGNLSISLPSVDGTVKLQRRNDDGRWAVVQSVWDPLTGALTYSPQDVNLLNGTFAVTLKKKVNLPWLLLLLGN